MTLSLLLCAAICVSFLSCDFENSLGFNHGLGPSTTKITGQVIFDDASARPANVDEVRVAVTSRSLTEILQGEIGLEDIYFSTPVAFDRKAAAYEISAPFGTYPLLGILWKERGKNWDININKIIGIYNANCDNTFTPRSVQLTKERPIAEHVDICAFWKIN
jgi:hypothetical protein